MALYYKLSWQDIDKDSHAQSLGLDMAEDLFRDRVWIYLTTAAITARLNKVRSFNPGLAYGTALELYMRELPNIDDSQIESFRRKWIEE